MKKLTTEQFILKAIKIHGDEYDYSKTNYVGRNKEISYRCKIHGEISQLAGNHLSGKGCKYCANNVTCRTDEFVDKSKSIHGGTYDYTKTYYGTNNKCKVIITCNIHGDFKQSPSEHLAGKGCELCARINRADQLRTTLSDFISNATEVHLGKYSYDNVRYIRTNLKVLITCHEHGNFLQTPLHHLSGTGCRKCAKHGFNPSKPATFYLFKINETILGFGITNDFKTRHKKHKSTFKKHNVNHELLQTYDCSGHQALAIENHLKQTYEIIDTGIEGFRREATEINHLPNILQDIKKLLDNNHETDIIQ